MKRNMNAKNAGLAVLLVLVMVVSSFSFLAGTGSAAAPAENTKADNVLNIAMQDDMKTLNPCKASDVWSWNVIGWFYDSTISRDKDMKLIPWLADPNAYGGQGWQYSTDNPTWANLTLRKGVKWHDGVELTGKDLVFTYKFFAGAPGYGAQVPRYLSSVMPLIWDNDSDGTPDWVGVWVDPNDPYTVHYHLSNQSATFVTDTLSMFVLPEHIWKDHMGSDKFSWPTDPADYQKAATGTGLFKLVTWQKLQYTELEANDNYFLGWPNVEHIDKIYFRIYQTTDSAVMALQSGEIDYIAWTIPPGYLPQLVENSKVTISQTDELGFFYMAWNLRRSPFNNLALRQAMAHCTDKQTIVSRLLLNYGSVGTSVVSPANKVWSNTSVTTYAYDLDAANKILDDQGWTKRDSNGWRYLPDIGDRQIVILTPPADYDPIRAEAGRMIADSCKEVGLNVVSKPTDFGTIVTKVYDEHDFDAYILGWSIGGLEPSYLQDFFTSPFDVPGGNNGIGCHNTTFDAKVDAMMKELNETKRIEMNKELQESVAFNLYYNVLYYRANLEAYRNDKYTGWYAELGGVFNTWTLWDLTPGTANKFNIRVTGQEKVAEGGTATLTVKVTNTDGSAVSGATVTITPTTGAMVQNSAVTDSNGIATFTYNANVGLSIGDSPQIVTFSVTAEKDTTKVTSNLAFSMTVYPPGQNLAIAQIDLAQMVVTSSDLANSGLMITVTVVDQDGNPLVGANFTIALSEADPNANFTGDTVTDTNGQAVVVFTYANLQETKDFDISVTPYYQNYTASTATASFTGVYVQPKMTMTLTLNPTSAKTGEKITVTVKLVNSETGAPISGASVSLDVNLDTGEFAAKTGTTDSSGVFTTTLTVSKISGETATATVTASATAAGYAAASQKMDASITAPQGSPDLSFVGVAGVLAIVALLGIARRRTH